MATDKPGDSAPRDSSGESSGRELYFSAAFSAVVGAVALAVGIAASGWLAVVAFILLALAVLYLLHIAFAVFAVGWLSRLLDRADSKTHKGQHRIQIRIPLASGEEPDFSSSLFEALEQQLASDGECSSMTIGPRQLRYDIYGSDPVLLRQACRAAAKDFELPAGTHLWRPDGTRAGERLEL